MKLSAPVSVKWISELINSEIIGNQELFISGVNEIHQVEKGDIVFVDHPKYYDKCLNSDASCIIINNKEVTIPEGKAILFCADPFEAYVKIVSNFKPFQLSNTAISPDLKMGKDSIILPNVFIGNNVTIGDNCIIYPGYQLWQTVLLVTM
jgi:UDP-3-O-[3-hydroxymyristoyl] glucosamine N-acyltransferase